ncbi:MAG: sulfatase-like hydrolase/transferase [Streptosporangiales bacterium]|nr:sulfatase-like hydrolase/transferase [Streptosporangiales bacterium]
MSTGSPTAPDILLMMVDQLGARWLEAAHEGVVDLPNLRRLQERGVTFANAYTNNPVCSPARATVATGLSSHGHGVTECGYALDPQVPTFMRALQQAGWRTGAFGKLHLVPQVTGEPVDYTAYGFDVVHVSEDQRTGEWLDWVERTHPEHYQAAQATVWMTMLRGLDDYGPDHRDLRAEIERARKSVRWATADCPEADSEAYPLPFPAEVSQSAWITDRALEFIAGVPAQTPLFAHVSYVQPHNPFAPPAEYVPRVATDRIPEPLGAEWLPDHTPAYFDRYPEPSWADRSWRHDRRMYFADLAHLDAELGRLLDGLAQAGRLENAHIVFTSDHGELLHDHGLLGKWERHYDSCIRIPFVVCGPGTMAGTTRTELVDLTDVAPTIYALAGLPEPELPRPDLGRPLVPERIGMLPGQSLLPLCRG